MSDRKAQAALALSCLDLTNLNDDCDEAAVEKLCRRAQTHHGDVAAVCVWPRFVGLAKRRLPGNVKVATVVNFPSGAEPVEDVIEMTETAIADGADEIDVVVPYRQLLEGNAAAVASLVERVKRAAAPAQVKAILETGVLETEEAIRSASDFALEGGADFLKTSTGKTPVSATLAAAEVLLHAIRDSGAQCGFKPSGGIRSTEDALNYLNLSDEVMGEGWAKPATFRIGASGVLDALLATLDGADEPEAGEGY